MADEQDQRPIRSNDIHGRLPTAAAANDPLAELARLIGQNDPFAEYGRETPLPIVDAEEHFAETAPPPAPKPASDYVVPPAAPSRTSDYVASPVSPSRSSDYVSPPMSRPSMPPPPKFEHEPLGVSPFAKATDLDQAATVPVHADAHAHDHDEHLEHEPMHAGEEDEYFEYEDEAPSGRRMGVIAVAAVIALAVVGTAGAFGYRAVFGTSGAKSPPPVIKADTTPSKIVPTPEKSETKQTKLSYDRVGARNTGEQLVSREEKPVAIEPKADGGMAAPGTQTAALQPALGSGVVGGEPKKVHTIVIHPGEPAGANPVTAAPAAKPPAAAAPHAASPAAPAARTVTAPMPEPRHVATRTVEAPSARVPAHSNAPLSLNPGAAPPRAAARPAQTASTAPTQAAPPPAAANGGHGYAVQLSAQRSEAEAQASFRSMQAKYPGPLGGQQLMVRKVELGTKGTYYRTLVGPFGSQNAAVELCTKLKAAGGKCFVQKI